MFKLKTLEVGCDGCSAEYKKSPAIPILEHFETCITTQRRPYIFDGEKV